MLIKFLLALLPLFGGQRHGEGNFMRLEFTTPCDDFINVYFTPGHFGILVDSPYGSTEVDEPVVKRNGRTIEMYISERSVSPLVTFYPGGVDVNRNEIEANQ